MNKLHEYDDLINLEYEESNKIEKEDYTKIGVSSIFNTNLQSFTNGLMPKYKKTYIALDRRNRPIESTDYKTFTWNITNRRDNRSSGTVYLPADIKKIIQIKIMPFKFNTDMTDATIEIANMPFTVNIPEINQGFRIGNEQFQFMGKPISPGETRDGDMIIVFNKGCKILEIGKNLVYDAQEPLYYQDNSSYNEGVFTLEENFNFTNTISIQFGFPFKKIPLRQARFTITSQRSASSGSPTEFVISNPNNITTEDDVFYLDDFKYTANNANNAAAMLFYGDPFLLWKNVISTFTSTKSEVGQKYISPSFGFYKFMPFSGGTTPTISSGTIYSPRLGFEICFEIIYEV